jgi:hypothetical protein
MGENDLRAGAQDKLYSEACTTDWEPPFDILFTKEIYIEASHLLPPNHFKWFWWEVAKQVKFFQAGAPEDYQRIVIKYVKVKRQDPPGWWPDLTPFTDYEDTYIGLAMDIDAPWDSADTDPPTPFVGDESATNLGAYDATNEIAYLSGFGNHEHPEYSDFHAGIALAEGGSPGTTPFATSIVKNNQWLYPTSPWGWIDGELYQLAKGVPGNPYIEDPDSLVDRSIVMTAAHIPAGTEPGTKAEFTIIEAIAPTGLSELQALIDTGRAIVARERAHGIPAACGDANGDYVVNVGDIVYLVTYLYKGGPAPLCPLARGDANNDGVINVGDVVYLVTFAYKGGPEPKCPGIWYW